MRDHARTGDVGNKGDAAFGKFRDAPDHQKAKGFDVAEFVVHGRFVSIRLCLFSSRLMGTNMPQKAPLPEQTPPRKGVV